VEYRLFIYFYFIFNKATAHGRVVKLYRKEFEMNLIMCLCVWLD